METPVKTQEQLDAEKKQQEQQRQLEQQQRQANSGGLPNTNAPPYINPEPK